MAQDVLDSAPLSMKPFQEKQISRWRASSDYEAKVVRPSSHTAAASNEPLSSEDRVESVTANDDPRTTTRFQEGESSEPVTHCPTGPPRLPSRTGRDSSLVPNNARVDRESLSADHHHHFGSKRDVLPTYVRPPRSPMPSTPTITNVMPALKTRIDEQDWNDSSSLAPIPIWSLQESAVDPKAGRKEAFSGRQSYYL